MANSMKALVYDYLNDGSSDVRVLDEFMKMPIYNIPVRIRKFQGPDRTILELANPARRALTLNGYNHTPEGIVAIRSWAIDMQGRPEGRPDQLLLFQPMFGSLVSTMFKNGHEFKSITDPMHFIEWLDKDYPCKRMLFLSAFDALNQLSNHTDSECRRRPSDTAPHPSKVDVLFVHRLDASVIVDPGNLRLSRRYCDGQSNVSSNQTLLHKVVSNTIAYVGNVSMSRAV